MASILPELDRACVARDRARESCCCFTKTKPTSKSIQIERIIQSIDFSFIPYPQKGRLYFLFIWITQDRYFKRIWRRLKNDASHNGSHLFVDINVLEVSILVDWLGDQSITLNLQLKCSAQVSRVLMAPCDKNHILSLIDRMILLLKLKNLIH